MKSQRWLLRRHFEAPRERINPRLYDVESISEADAKRFVIAHHYSGSYPATRCRVGLFRRGVLAGVAVFSVPMNQRVIPRRLGLLVDQGADLGRFVLLDSVPFNGETWFLKRAFAVAQAELSIRGVVAYCDPVPREAQGQVIKPGHFGTIYRAHNAKPAGRSSPRTLTICRATGRAISPRTISKARNGERGHQHAQRIIDEAKDTYTIRHPGNLIFKWMLN